MVDVLDRPTVEFQEAAAPTPPQRNVTLKIDADLLEWLTARGEDAAQEINGLLRFYKDTAERKENEFDPDAWEPGEFHTAPPTAPVFKRVSAMKLVEIFQQRNPDYLLSIRGQDMPTTDMVKAASFRTDLPTDDALTEALRLTNAGSWEENSALIIEPGEHHSTSVGDVVVVDNEAYQCQRHGWKRLETFKPA